jgi:hypothetical protein
MCSDKDTEEESELLDDRDCQPIKAAKPNARLMLATTITLKSGINVFSDTDELLSVADINIPNKVN